MSEHRLPSIRTEVGKYISSCEHLLSSAIAPDKAAFSQEELYIIDYYTAEVVKAFMGQAKAVS